MSGPDVMVETAMSWPGARVETAMSGLGATVETTKSGSGGDTVELERLSEARDPSTGELG